MLIVPPVRKNMVIPSFTYFMLYCFLFWVAVTNFYYLLSFRQRETASSWIYMRVWLGCQVWFNSNRPLQVGPSMSTRDEMKLPLIKVMQILLTVAMLSRNSPLFTTLSLNPAWQLLVYVFVAVLAGLCQHRGVTWKVCPADKWHVGCDRRRCFPHYRQAESSAPTSLL